MIIETLDKRTCDSVGKIVAEVAGKALAMHGLTAEFAGGRFSPTELTLKLRVQTGGAGKAEEARRALEFKSYATLYGLKPTDLGRKFCFRDRHYEVIGFAGRSRKFPILCREIGTGKEVRFSAVAVKRELA